MDALLILFLVVLVLNLVPAFAPPTWMVFSYSSALAKMAHAVVRNRWMTDVSREKVDSLKGSMEKRPKLTFGLFLSMRLRPCLPISCS